jgi:hypothetical protein
MHLINRLHANTMSWPVKQRARSREVANCSCMHVCSHALYKCQYRLLSATQVEYKLATNLLSNYRCSTNVPSLLLQQAKRARNDWAIVAWQLNRCVGGNDD